MGGKACLDPAPPALPNCAVTLRLLPLLLLLTGPLAASDDWLSLAVPRPLAVPWELSLGLDQAQRELWGQGASAPQMQDSDGIKVQRVLAGWLDLRWQAGHSLSLGLHVPASFDELAVWTGGIAYPRLDDPGIARVQGLGDVSVSLRQDRGAPQGWALGWGLRLTAPTGLGPYESPQPLASTGEGRWQGRLRASAGGTWGAWQAFVDAQLSYQAGREAVLSPAAPLRYDEQGPVFAPPGLSGAVYLGPRWGARAALGVGWDWYHDDNARHSVALSAVAWQRAPLSLDGQAIAGTEEVLLTLQPELQARFGAFEALVGWQASPLWAQGLSLAYWGELHFRLDYGF